MKNCAPSSTVTPSLFSNRPSAAVAQPFVSQTNEPKNFATVQEPALSHIRHGKPAPPFESSVALAAPAACTNSNQRQRARTPTIPKLRQLRRSVAATAVANADN